LRAKAIILQGIADPDVVDEDVVLAKSSSGHGLAKSNFEVGRVKSDFLSGHAKSDYEAGRAKWAKP